MGNKAQATGYPLHLLKFFGSPFLLFLEIIEDVSSLGPKLDEHISILSFYFIIMCI
jgi:hypothetical protein